MDLGGGEEMVDGVSLCLACQRAVLSALLASNPIVRPPTRASMRRPSPFTARMGPRLLDRAGAHSRTGLLPRSISLSGDRTPGRGTGILSSAQGPPRVHGVHGVQAIQSQVPNPPAGVSLVDIARAVGGEKLLISCPDPKPRKKKKRKKPSWSPKPDPETLHS